MFQEYRDTHKTYEKAQARLARQAVDRAHQLFAMLRGMADSKEENRYGRGCRQK